MDTFNVTVVNIMNEMQNLEWIYTFFNRFALLGWLFLLLLPQAKVTEWLSRYFVFPIALSLGYLVFISVSFDAKDFVGFATLTGLMQLFQDPLLVLAGWVHYLAFDLFVGIWVAQKSKEYGIAHWRMIPILLLCFFFGPIGFLCFMILSASKKYAGQR